MAVKKKGKLWKIDPAEPITFHADLNQERLLKGKIPPEVQAAIRDSIRHAVIGTLEAHRLLDRNAAVDFEPDQPIKHPGTSAEGLDTILS